MHAPSVLLVLSLLFASTAAAQDSGTGSVRGRVLDAMAGTPLEGVGVTLVSPEGETSRTTDAKGGFAFESVPAAEYQVRYRKSGYRDATLERAAVRSGETSRADMSLSAAPTGAAPTEPVDIEEFVVVASPLAEILAASRMNSDELINTLNAEDMAKFAASDVADALKFVAGVNVVEGQFAIIRGLEDRYSSTLYNFAPIPSPDPDSQSVQLDLFPSDVVGNLVVAKTFAPELPSNSSGGSINILTHEYPEQLELKFSSGSGFESYAKDRFLRYNEGSSVGWEESGLDDVLESYLGVTLGGPLELRDREIRFKGLFTREIDYRTAEGYKESREPRSTEFERPSRPPPRGQPAHEPTISRSGDLSLGELFLSDGLFDMTESERSQQTTGYGAIGLDLDPDGDHKIDASYFYTKKEEETVQLFENGRIPSFDYDGLADIQNGGGEIQGSFFNDFATEGSWIARTVRSAPDNGPTRGPLWYTNFSESASFKTDRDLRVWQLNGDHNVEWIEGLRFNWAANKAKTSQSETAMGTRYFFEPTDLTRLPSRFPGRSQSLGDGQYATNSGIVLNTNEIEEKQDFGRLDGTYERDVTDYVTLEVSGGGWYEKSDRDVASTFLEGPTLLGNTQFAVLGETPQDLGEDLLSQLDAEEDGDPSVLREATNQSERKIKAWHVSGKATLWDRLDLFGGIRREHIFIQSLNDPFIEDGENARFGAPATFPEVYILFDRLDNPERGEVSRAVTPGTVFNDQILGVEVPVDPETGLVDLTDRAAIEALVNGTIDETKLFPSAGFTLRPIEGLAVRGAWSKTVARPSFREMGFYVSVEPASDDLVVGNPQLKLSEVKSWDGRVEYTWGSLGDLVAVSGFYKKIGTPIESIVIRNPINFESSSSALYRTFFNNPNEATLYGFEAEARKSLDFLGVDFLRYFSIGGNYTWIHAEVDRTEAELARSRAFFGVADGDTERFEELDPSRRLFNQPEWIANADFTFEHPDWGTKVTLAYFAISNVLDAAGSAFLRPDGTARDYTLDRYVDSFHQLDLVLSQRLWSGLTLKASVKNLTNSTRQIVYDPGQTRHEISERSFKIGRDYSISLSYTLEF